VISNGKVVLSGKICHPHQSRSCLSELQSGITPAVIAKGGRRPWEKLPADTLKCMSLPRDEFNGLEVAKAEKKPGGDKRCGESLHECGRCRTMGRITFLLRKRDCSRAIKRKHQGGEENPRVKCRLRIGRNSTKGKEAAEKGGKAG